MARNRGYARHRDDAEYAHGHGVRRASPGAGRADPPCRRGHGRARFRGAGHRRTRHRQDHDRRARDAHGGRAGPARPGGGRRRRAVVLALAPAARPARRRGARPGPRVCWTSGATGWLRRRPRPGSGWSSAPPARWSPGRRPTGSRWSSTTCSGPTTRPCSCCATSAVSWPARGSSSSAPAAIRTAPPRCRRCSPRSPAWPPCTCCGCRPSARRTPAATWRWSAVRPSTCPGPARCTGTAAATRCSSASWLGCWSRRIGWPSRPASYRSRRSCAGWSGTGSGGWGRPATGCSAAAPRSVTRSTWACSPPPAPDADPGVLTEAVAAGVLVEDADAPTRLRFSHGLVRQAAYESLGRDDRVDWHRRIAAVLRADGRGEEHAAELARHTVRAAVDAESSRAAVLACRAAADAASRQLAFDDAARWLRQAAELLGPAGADDAGTCRDPARPRRGQLPGRPGHRGDDALRTRRRPGRAARPARAARRGGRGGPRGQRTGDPRRRAVRTGAGPARRRGQRPARSGCSPSTPGSTPSSPGRRRPCRSASGRWRWPSAAATRPR